ncbi:(2Fe-2S)-binding protein [Gluconobacter wancherniae]|uniref:(2Fe-2S)-binding protein n=1 Tax=Gluconobacter wancherniae TaxID=1307955 RepID=UPI001B8D790D|nr:(2Fe-2S)-binding protein [Gluconobacter wancherniae]MBS1087441.1 (2Fe-2S)-binding protein [Gluconobacter wancherniae]
MIVCSCNALSHKDVEAAIDSGASRPAEIYSARRCKAQCGNCVPGMLCMLRSALRDRDPAAAAASERAGSGCLLADTDRMSMS